MKELLENLLREGLVYRYTPERWKQLSGGGQPFPSLTQEVDTPQGKMVEELIQPVLSPIILTAKEKAQLESIAKIWSVFIKAQQKLFEMAKKKELDSFVRGLVLATATREEKEKSLIFPGYSGIPFIRLDAVRTREGFKVVDINSTRPAGVGDCIIVSRILSSYFKEKVRPYPFDEIFVDTVTKCISEWSNNFSKKISKLLMIQSSYADDWHNFRILKETLQQRSGLEVRMAVVSEINEINQEGVLRGRIKEGHPGFTLLSNHYPERFVISPLWKRYLGNKLWMYLINLRDLDDFWKENLGIYLDVLRESFASTFPVRYGQMLSFEGDFFSSDSLDRKEWILKVPSGSSARGMIFGKMTGKKRWEEEIESSQGIIQKFERAKEKLTVLNGQGELQEEEFYAKYGIFILGGKLAGIEVMARRNPVVHGARNAYFTAVFQK